MEELVRQVRRARRRLAWQRFLTFLPWCWFAALGLAMFVVVADRFALGGLQPAEQLADWAGWEATRTVSQVSWLFFGVTTGSALGLGLIAALGFVGWSRTSPLDAAVEIDRRFGLRERVSSSLALTLAERETRAGRAVVEDAIRRVRDVQVSEKFALQLGRGSWAPFVPAALAFALAIFWHPSWDTPSKAKARGTTADRQRIKVSAAKLQNQVAEKVREAEEKGLEKTTELFKKLEQATDEMAKAPNASKEDALKKLKDLEAELQKRREELGGDGLKEQFAQMKNMPQGPGDKMVQAMKDGNFKKAEEELKKLAEQLKDGKLGAKEKDALQKQLKEMENKLAQMADGHEKAMQKLRDQLAKEKQGGNKKEAAKLQEMLDKLAKGGQGMKAAKMMSMKLGALGEQFKGGNNQAAMEAMQELAAALAKMQNQTDELAMLDELMEQMGECKGGMCQGQGQKPGNKPSKGDFATGKGRGAGERAEEKTKFGTFDTRTKPKSPGSDAQVVDFVDGANMKGDVQQEIAGQFAKAEQGGESDALTSQPLSRNYRDHAEDYFESLVDPK